MSFCQVCSKCPQCCQRAGCRGQTSEVLAEVGNTGSESKGGLHLAGRLYPSIQDEAPPTRFPLIKSGYANPARSRALSEALSALIESW